MRRAFQFFDKDGSGSISLPEFDKALKEYIMLDLDEPTVRGCFERFGEAQSPKATKAKSPVSVVETSSCDDVSFSKW